MAIVTQRIQKGNYRTDLVAYDYTQVLISVEIESVSEVNNHLEHVRYNMAKWTEMGFVECHV